MPIPAKSPKLYVTLLQPVLVHQVALYLAAKQAHWIVRGPHFASLHELFGQVADSASAAADTVAERIAQLDGVPSRELPVFEVTNRAGLQLLAQVSAAASEVARLQLVALTDLMGEGDQVSANMLLTLQEGLEKLIWMLDSHLL